MHPAFDLQGRTALVTGSSRGIGRAIALGLAESGARVIFHGAAPSSELASATAEAGNEGLALSADLADRAAVRGLCAHALAAAGQVDILVLNASIEIREPWQATTDAAFDRQVAVNLDASRLLIEGLVPDMAERGWGRVLAIGSVQEVKEHPRMLVYAALKAAQSSIMRNLARQLAPRGVTCNTLAPGVIATGRNEAVLADEAYRDSVRSRIPMEAFGMPGDCVGAALLLCSDAGRYITGERLIVDGGMHL
jgi:NAD(P)-dependent dehydrogenase (short-subunit alcohol dehydrogenase family)